MSIYVDANGKISFFFKAEYYTSLSMHMEKYIRSSGEGNGNPLQYSCLENLMDGGTCWATVHRIAELDMTEPLHFHFSLSYIDR